MSRQSTGYVYFVQAPINGLIKIGFSRESPESRLAVFLSVSPVPVNRLAIIRAGIQFEQKLHRRFGHLLSHSEWFRPGEDLLGFVRDWAWPWVRCVTAEDLAGIPSKYSRKTIEVMAPWDDPFERERAAIKEAGRLAKSEEYRSHLYAKRAEYLKKGFDTSWIDQRIAKMWWWPEPTPSP